MLQELEKQDFLLILHVLPVIKTTQESIRQFLAAGCFLNEKYSFRWTSFPAVLEIKWMLLWSFLLLITSQIHQKMIEAVKSLGDNTISIHDIRESA